jgi:hypothetical protein
VIREERKKPKHRGCGRSAGAGNLVQASRPWARPASWRSTHSYCIGGILVTTEFSAEHENVFSQSKATWFVKQDTNEP